MFKKGLKIGLVQTTVTHNRRKNVANAIAEIYKAKEKGCELVCLPGYFFSSTLPRRTCEAYPLIPSEAVNTVISKAAADTAMCIVGGCTYQAKGDDVVTATNVWGSDGQLLATCTKMHLFDIDIPNKITLLESEVLKAGDQVTTFDFKGFRVGLGICHDLRFPEIAQLLAKKGCSLLIYPGAFNMATGPKHWELLGRARAVDHQLWVALVSPSRGSESTAMIWGHSTLVDPLGQVVDKLDEHPGTLVADIDLQTVDEVRRQMKIRSQRRTDVYELVYKSK